MNQAVKIEAEVKPKPKVITLNGHVRSEIIKRIMQRWREENPVKTVAHSLDLTTSDLKARDALRQREQEYRHNLSLALGTFKTVGALVAEWPEIEGYVPQVLTEPRRVIDLPSLPK